MGYRQGAFSSQGSADARLARFAARRHGLFTYADAITMGLTKRMVHGRVATGRWERVFAGVYRLTGAPSSWRQMILAACLASGNGAVASHGSAAALWGLAGFEPGDLDVSVPRGRRPLHPGVRVHQVPLASVDVTMVDSIPVTTPARTLLDLAGVAGADAVEEALDDALRRGSVTVPRLRWRLEQLGRRPGAALIRRLLGARSGADARTQSVQETRLLRLMRRAALPEPVCQHEIRDRGRLMAIVDFAYPDTLLAIEVDGYRWHSGRSRWQRDLTRPNAITRLGWRVIHVTAEDLERRPRETIRIIVAGLARNRPRPAV